MRTRRSRSLPRAAAWIAVALALTLVAPVHADQGSAGGANGVRLVVSPRTVRNLDGEVMVRVTGSGFSTTENNAFGIYLSFGRRPTGDRVGHPAFTDATVAYDGGAGHGTKWIRPQAPSGPNQARLAADGTFSVDIAVKARYTAPNGQEHAYDEETLGIYSYAAHGLEAQADGFSQRAFVALRFRAPATAKPTAKPTPKRTAKPTAKPTPRATPTAKPESVAPSAAAASSPGVGPSATPAASASPAVIGAAPSVSARPAPTATGSASPPAVVGTTSAASAGIGPAIPLLGGVLILAAVVAARLFRRRV